MAISQLFVGALTADILSLTWSANGIGNCALTWRSGTSSDASLQNKSISKQTFQSLLETSSEKLFVYLHMLSGTILLN